MLLIMHICGNAPAAAAVVAAPAAAPAVVAVAVAAAATACIQDLFLFNTIKRYY